MQCNACRISGLAYPTLDFRCLANYSLRPLLSQECLSPVSIPFRFRGNDSFVTNWPRLPVSSHRDQGTTARGSSSAVGFLKASRRNGPLTLPHHQTCCGVFFLSRPKVLLLTSHLEDPIRHRCLSHLLIFAAAAFVQLLSSCNNPSLIQCLLRSHTFCVRSLILHSVFWRLELHTDRHSPHLRLGSHARNHSQERKVRADSAP